MPTKEALRAEIRNLRAEIDEMRRARDEEEAAKARREWASSTHGYDDDSSMSGIDDNGLDDDNGAGDENDENGADEHESQLKDIEKALGDLADEAGKEIAERPLVAVLAAFVLGIVAGRLLSR